MLLNALPLISSLLGSGQEPWTPTHVVFASERDGSRDLYRIPVGGGEVVRLTHWNGSGHRPHFNWPVATPDGRTLVMMADTDGHDRYALWTLGIDGEDLARLTPEGIEAFYPAVSPDGARVAPAGRLGGRWHLSTIGIDGDDLRVVSDFEGGRSPRWGPAACWSPEGDALWFGWDKGGDVTLWSLSLEDGELSALGRLPGSTRPAPSRDGSMLAYLGGEFTGTGLRLESLLPEGTSRELDGPFSKISSPAWSPDGRRILAVGPRDGSLDVLLVDLQEDTITPLAPDPALELAPCWVRLP